MTLKRYSMQPERGVYEITGQLKGAEEGKHFITYVMNSPAMLDRIDAAASKVGSHACKRNKWLGIILYIDYSVYHHLYFILLLIEPSTRWRKPCNELW